MQIDVTLDLKTYPIEVPDYVINEGDEFFTKMDADMDAGWQMGREWVETPNPQQRGQIIASRLMQAIEDENNNLILLCAGYLLKRFPGIQGVNVDPEGEVGENELLVG